MRCLVTGAGGFLGRRVIASLQREGHEAVALVRDPAARAAAGWGEGVDVRVADLREPLDPELIGDADAVLHLAAVSSGPEEEQFAGTVATTERLLEAVVAAGTRRVVLAGSMSVYDWTAAVGAVDERTPLAADLYRRDGYAIAKTWQERVLVAAAERSGFEAVVLRPGFIWGPGRIDNAGIGQAVGATYISFGRRRRLPLTYVENCADAFVRGAEAEGIAGRVVNIVDGDEVRVAEYARYVVECDPGLERVLALPGPVASGLVRLVAATAYRGLGRGARLPSLFIPARFDARFRDLRFPSDVARDALGWGPAVSFGEAMRRSRPQPR